MQVRFLGISLLSEVSLLFREMDERSPLYLTYVVLCHFYVSGINSEITVMRSMQKPKRISFEGSDGKHYIFLVKSDDDLRKDARSMELNYAINSFLKKNPESRDNELC